MTRTLLRTAGVLATAAAFLGVIAGPALAHVTVHPDHAEQGGYTKLTFQVPNEEDHASTTKLQVTLPTKTPIRSVSVQPHPGWSYQVTMKKLAKPMQTKDGPVQQVVSKVTWTSTSQGAAIKPGQFDEFAISAGPLPSDTDTLEFPALQTYSNGDVVRWIQTAAPGAPEPAHPAPTLHLAAATDPTGTNAPPRDATGSQSHGDTATLALSIAALVIALGTAGATGYVLRRRRT